MLYPILEQYDVDIKKAAAYGFVAGGRRATLRKDVAWKQSFTLSLRLQARPYP